MDKIVPDLQILVIKTAKISESMSRMFSTNALQIFFCLIALSTLSKRSPFADFSDSLQITRIAPQIPGL